jgi:hypothetical protein
MLPFFLAALATAASAAPTAPPTASPVPDASILPAVAGTAWWHVQDPKDLALLIWVSALLVVTIAVVAIAAVRIWGKSDAATVDRDLEASKLFYGFLLIVTGLVVVLAVVIVSVNLGSQANVSGIIAIVTAVTGAIGTLTTAFFGIQAAGAGSAQFAKALAAQSAGAAAAGQDFKIDPSSGPHAGNTRVSISGNGLTGATAVNFGGTPGMNFELVNDGLIRVTTPKCELDETAMTQKGKSDVAVTVVFPGAAAANKGVGTFYYYTVKAENVKDADGKETRQLRVYGSGLAGASQVQLGTHPGLTLTVTWAGENYLSVDLAKYTAVDWKAIWDQEIEVAVVYGSDTAAKRVVIGRFRIPEYSDTDPSAVVVDSSGPPPAAPQPGTPPPAAPQPGTPPPAAPQPSGAEATAAEPPEASGGASPTV